MSLPLPPSRRRALAASTLAAALLLATTPLTAQEATPKALAGFDAWMAQVMKDWNAPGIGVGVVVKDKLVFAKGYGYRDWGKKLPFTPETQFPIASNSKLFTATIVGMLVEDGKLQWDVPIARQVPQVRFYNDELTNTVTLRDMLSHRTGITRHDGIWYKGPFTRAELFDRLRYLEPQQPGRTTFLYNNLMYAGAGYIAELVTGKTWEAQVRARLFGPLGMTASHFDVDSMTRTPDHVEPWTESRDTTTLRPVPLYREQGAIGPAGSIITNIRELSHWLIAQMNGGRWEGKAVIPPAVIKATMTPSLALPNAGLEAYGWGELLNSTYGMGRNVATYRGHLVTYHGGDLPGVHSQVSFMPGDSIGVIVFVVGDHAQPLYNVVTWQVYERMLGLSPTPWSDRQNTIRLKNRAANRTARQSAGAARVAGTRPAHPMDDYVGEFAHPAYGVVTVARGGDGLTFSFHGMTAPLTHFHYERFDTPDADDDGPGKVAVNFVTNPQGDVDRLTFSLDEAEVTFTRRPAAALSDRAVLARYAGNYVTPTGAAFQVVLRDNGTLAVVRAGQPPVTLDPYKPHTFRIAAFSDVTIRFEVTNGAVTALVQSDPSGEHRSVRK